jgi:hypothetical protein
MHNDPSQIRGPKLSIIMNGGRMTRNEGPLVTRPRCLIERTQPFPPLCQTGMQLELPSWPGISNLISSYILDLYLAASWQHHGSGPPGAAFASGSLIAAALCTRIKSKDIANSKLQHSQVHTNNIIIAGAGHCLP